MRRRAISMMISILLLGGGAASAAGTANPGPSFDCAKASGKVPLLICKDAGLAKLDRREAELYALLDRVPPKVATRQREVQKDWLRGRDDCGKADDARACVERAYQTRIIDLQLQTRQLRVPPSVVFDCPGGPEARLFASFYSETEPPSAVFSFRKKLVIALSARGANGKIYQAPNVEFAERGDEATLSWYGTTMKCRRHAIPPPAPPKTTATPPAAPAPAKPPS